MKTFKILFAAMTIGLALSISSCEDDNLDQEEFIVTYDCPELQHDYGDICAYAESSQGIWYGVVSPFCECVPNDTINYDCPDLQLNILDTIYTPGGAFLGIVLENCQLQISESFCTSLDNSQDGESGYYTEACILEDGELGTIEECNCEADLSPLCSNLFNGTPTTSSSVYGSPCETNAGEQGIISSYCQCIPLENVWFCEDQDAIVGQACPNGPGFVNTNCECVEDPDETDCPSLGLNIGDICTTPNGGSGTVTANCHCE